MTEADLVAIENSAGFDICGIWVERPVNIAEEIIKQLIKEIRTMKTLGYLEEVD